MSAAVHPHASLDQTDLPYVLRAALRLGVLETLAVLVIGLVSKLLDGPAEQGLLGLLTTAAVLAVIFLPGQWTRAATIEGIAGAAGIGLAATVVFLVADVLFLQGNLLPFALYTHRWLDIGGGSNWWYHPIWWMVGTYLPWFGAWILAAQRSRNRTPSIAAGAALVVIFTGVVTVLAVVLGVPGAGWNVGTYGVAFLPGLALATAASVLGARRK